MRCQLCRRLSLQPICPDCAQVYLKPAICSRKLPCGLEVRSFFRYEEIEPLLLTKHFPHGRRIFRQLAQCAFAGLELPADQNLHVIAVDDRVESGWSHTAVMAHTLCPRRFTPLYGVLQAKNRVHYSGKSLGFRQQHPRMFRYTGPVGITALLVDDVLTTGTTLAEAYSVLRGFGIDVPLALVLADVQ